jgi:hypothetical protein
VDRGRKPNQESRSAEFRRRLIGWKQIPESHRPSLRTLARDLGTSHQLLSHLLNGLEKWREKERYREAKNRCKEIRLRAEAEKRALTQSEKEQFRASDQASARALLGSILLNKIESIKREAKRVGLNSHHIKMLKVFARNGFPEAQELLQKYPKTVQPKPRKLELTAKQQHLMDTLPKAVARRYARWLASVAE